MGLLQLINWANENLASYWYIFCKLIQINLCLVVYYYDTVTVDPTCANSLNMNGLNQSTRNRIDLKTRRHYCRMSTGCGTPVSVKIFKTEKERYRTASTEHPLRYSWYPPHVSWYPPRYSRYSPTFIMISPLDWTPHGTHNIPPHVSWHPHGTEHIIQCEYHMTWPTSFEKTCLGVISAMTGKPPLIILVFSIQFFQDLFTHVQSV